ncbi:hypothetical protein ACQR0Z_04950 [Bradyrhizobium sp. HKCCYLS3077]|uniref:hypothetical protein n=1 Tax=unclassified Bradyrhizobium TaxID=2631580 RepID=UPI002916DB7B|nr:hypothetical protein [Bradyrhizobium sp. SZCCHNR1015]
MSKLAREFGISDVGLKKVCDRHRVPTPGRGYWAQLEAGKNPKKTHFTDVPEPALNRIEIRPGLVDLPEPVRQVIEARKAERKLAAPRRQRLLAPAPIHEPITDVHPAVRQTVQALRKCTPSSVSAEAFGDGLCGVTVGRESIERAAYVLDRLARALEVNGTPLAPTGEAMQVTVGPERAVFNLKERTRTVAHVPTADELAEVARRREQRERHWRNPSRWPAPPYGAVYPERDTVWTGELLIQIDGYSDGVRRSWADGRTQRLEDLVSSVVDGITVLLAARKVARQQREERDRREAELQRRHDLARARSKREEARSAFADDIVKLTREADALRSWLAQGHLTKAPQTNGQVARFRAWLKDRLQTIENKLDPVMVERVLANQKLFPNPEEDELHDPLGDPPPRRWY